MYIDYDERFAECLENWSLKKHNIFLRACSSIITDKKHVGEFALALAYGVHTGEKSAFFEDHDFDETDALCFLYVELGSCYEDEINKVYDDFLQTEKEAFYD